MAGIPPKRPSAMDGYRRLERTRSAVGAAMGVDAVTPIEPGRSRRTRRLTAPRVAGALRLVAFVGVLALIIGTSVSLASADERSEPVRAAAPTAAPKTVEPKTAEPESKADTTEPADTSEPASRASESKDDSSPAEAAADEPEPADAVTVEPTASAASANGQVPTSTLPLTGDVQVRWLLLGGASLVLLGMLVQIGGQPLPARVRARA